MASIPFRDTPKLCIGGPYDHEFVNYSYPTLVVEKRAPFDPFNRTQIDRSSEVVRYNLTEWKCGKRIYILYVLEGMSEEEIFDKLFAHYMEKK